MTIPEQITTTRLALRPFGQGDAEDLFEYASNPEYVQFQSGPEDFTRTAADKFLAELLRRDRAVQPAWAITLDAQVVGIVSLTLESEQRVGVLGYGLHRRLWGRGLATEAVRALLDAAFASCPALHRIRAHTNALNLASVTLLTKLGFVREGVLRHNQFRRGVFVDESVFGLLRGEWTDHAR